jgi:predicted nucleic acid-binding protein
VTSKGPSGPFFVAEASHRLDLVIDTNVVLDMLVFRDPPVLAVLAALASDRYRWIGCRAMRDELAHVLDRGVGRAFDRGAVLAAYDGAVVELDPPWAPGVLRCTDPDDQVFIDLALQRRAHALLTRDRALLRLARRARGFGVAVVGPALLAQPAPTAG